MPGLLVTLCSIWVCFFLSQKTANMSSHKKAPRTASPYKNDNLPLNVQKELVKDILAAGGIFSVSAANLFKTKPKIYESVSCLLCSVGLFMLQTR